MKNTSLFHVNKMIRQASMLYQRRLKLTFNYGHCIHFSVYSDVFLMNTIINCFLGKTP